VLVDVCRCAFGWRRRLGGTKREAPDTRRRPRRRRGAFSESRRRLGRSRSRAAGPRDGRRRGGQAEVPQEIGPWNAGGERVGLSFLRHDESLLPRGAEHLARRTIFRSVGPPSFLLCLLPRQSDGEPDKVACPFFIFWVRAARKRLAGPRSSRTGAEVPRRARKSRAEPAVSGPSAEAAGSARKLRAERGSSRPSTGLPGRARKLAERRVNSGPSAEVPGRARKFPVERGASWPSPELRSRARSLVAESPTSWPSHQLRGRVTDFVAERGALGVTSRRRQVLLVAGRTDGLSASTRIHPLQRSRVKHATLRPRQGTMRVRHVR
jgi:hypothetical protein